MRDFTLPWFCHRFHRFATDFPTDFSQIFHRCPHRFPIDFPQISPQISHRFPTDSLQISHFLIYHGVVKRAPFGSYPWASSTTGAEVASYTSVPLGTIEWERSCLGQENKVSRHAGTPIAGWFIMENPSIIKWVIWGYIYLRKPPCRGNMMVILW